MRGKKTKHAWAIKRADVHYRRLTDPFRWRARVILVLWQRVSFWKRQNDAAQYSPQMFITASVLKSSPSIHSRALNCKHTQTSTRVIPGRSGVGLEVSAVKIKQWMKSTDAQIQLPVHLHELHTRYITLYNESAASHSILGLFVLVHCQTNCCLFVVSLSTHQAVDKMSILRVKQIE